MADALKRLVLDIQAAGAFPAVGASVLCPAFVATNIYDQSKYAEATAPKPTKGADKLFASMPGSISAAELADKVFASVTRGDLYILTHQVADGLRKRADDILNLATPGGGVDAESSNRKALGSVMAPKLLPPLLSAMIKQDQGGSSKL